MKTLLNALKNIFFDRRFQKKQKLTCLLCVLIIFGIINCQVEDNNQTNISSSAVINDSGTRAIIPPLGNNGVVNPSSYYQRYRRNEYPLDKTYFQWWYFTIKDLKNNRYYAFMYSLLDCISNLKNESSSAMFAMVDKNNSTRFHKIESFPLNNLKASNYFDISIDANKNDNAVEYRIEVIDDNTYHLTGKMHSPQNVTFADGKIKGQPLDPAIYIEWDLTIHRIYGWYGQDSMENTLKKIGVINWNTYAHSAEVNGTITVGGTRYTIERNENFRAYCDENWGENYPTGKPGEPSIDYPWGWYYVGLPNSDLTKEVSIIAGIGRQYTDGMGINEGRFADIRLNNKTGIQAQMIEIFKPTPNTSGTDMIAQSNDGEIKKFQVERSNWVQYIDNMGADLIPLNQKVTIESEHYITVLDYYSQIEDYNRLIGAHENYVFSDFEGLGVNVHVTVTYHYITYSYRSWDILKQFPYNPQDHYEILYDFWSDDGGIEYGYKYDPK